jgi:rhodanese-related sulfurtransferase
VGLAVLICATNRVSAEELAPAISPVELRDRLKQHGAPQVIDVRSQAEFETGHVPGAVNIPHNELANRLDEVDAASDVVLYCMIGPRARLGEQTLRKAGVDGLLHLDGGFAAWRDAGLSAE